MSDKRFILAMAISALTSLAVIAIMPYLPRVQTDPEVIWTANLYAKKLAALHSIQSDRIYVIGGSSSLFSMDTQTLSRTVGHQVINFATHAGLGLTYILDRAEREMHPGDTIIFTPEYSILQQPETPDQLTLSYVAFFDRAYIGTRPLTERIHFYFGYNFPNSILETVRSLRDSSLGTRPDIVLDDLGNARGNTVSASVRDKMSFNAVAAPAPISGDAMVALRKFANIARASHIRIFVLPPALIHLPSWDTPAYRAFRSNVRATFGSLGMNVMGDDATGWVAPEGIYDSNYHANDMGRAIYTAKITSLLCVQLGCSHQSN